MGLSLTKGSNLSLAKEAPGLVSVRLGLGWDARTTDGGAFDLDASALGVGADGRIVGNGYFVFYNQKRSEDGSIEHGGDNLTGDGAGDDETITVTLAAVNPQVDKVVVVASIYDAEAKRVSFGQVRNAYVRLINAADDSEIARYDLSEDAAAETAMVFGELYRHGTDWKFRAVGQGYASGLNGIAVDYGVVL